jgi:hypothetical protein
MLQERIERCKAAQDFLANTEIKVKMFQAKRQWLISVILAT